jgi:uncharacterized protein (TIGR03083 family)
MMDVIAADRRELAGVLDTLTPAQWAGPSLCAGWTVAHVVAHLTMPFRITDEEFARGVQAAGGDFTVFSDGVAERDSKLPTADLVALLRDNAETPWSPPGGGLAAALSHDIIHGLDIAWPLGIRCPIADQAMITVLDLMVSPHEHSVFGVPLDGLELRATDLDWSAGSGAAVLGGSRDLLLLVANRRIPMGALSGPGTRLLGAQAR